MDSVLYLLLLVIIAGHNVAAFRGARLCKVPVTLGDKPWSARELYRSHPFGNPLQLSMIAGDSASLISIARDFVSSGFGVADPTLLSDAKFSCTGQMFKLYSKEKYVTGLSKETSAFRRAMPDFEFRPYDFEIDPANSNTVWFKIRPKGTLTGPFSFKGEVYLPNNAVVELPLQLCSVSVESGKVTGVTAGYVMDRFTGNTGGYPGPFGVLYALGYAPNKFTFSPPSSIVKQFFGRTRKPASKKVGVSPFPEIVMISLAKAMLDSSLGASDPSLLADNFLFSGPAVGPLPKKEYISTYNQVNLKKAIPDLDIGAVSFRVDSYEPDRVWVITRARGSNTGPLEIGGRVVQPASGNKYESPPEAVSFSFDESGKCYKASAGYVIDREQGNTNGLGGEAGILEAIGAPLPWWEKRSIPQVLINIKEGIFPTNVPAPSKESSTVTVIKPKPAPAPAPAPAPVKISAPALVKASAPAPAPGLSKVTVSVKAPAPVTVAKPNPAPATASTKIQQTKAPVSISAPVTSSARAPSPSGGFFGGLFGSGQQDFFDDEQPSKPKTQAVPAPKSAPPTKIDVAAEAKKKAEVEATKKKAEAQAQALARAKSEAEAKAKAQAQAQAEASSKAAPVVAAAKTAPAPKVDAVAEAKKKAEIEAKKKAEVEAKNRVDAAAKMKTEAEARKKAEAEAKMKADQQARIKAETEAKAKIAAAAKANAEAQAKVKIDQANAAAAKTKLQLQEESIRKFQALEAARKAPPAPSKTTVAAAPVPLPKSGPAPPSSVPIASNILTPSAIKALTSRGASQPSVSNIDALLARFLSGAVGPETVFGSVKNACGKDKAFDVFPDIIGSLPRGEQKSALNAWFQSQAN